MIVTVGIEDTVRIEMPDRAVSIPAELILHLRDAIEKTWQMEYSMSLTPIESDDGPTRWRAKIGDAKASSESPYVAIERLLQRNDI